MFKPDYTPAQLKRIGVYDNVYGGGKQLASMDKWPDHWLHPQDPKGWLQWYERYSAGRRTEDDSRQISRWLSFKARHGAQFSKKPTPRRAYALQNWAIDPTKLVEDKDSLITSMDTYKQKLVKAALQIEQKQVPTADQVTRQPTAVVIQGNQDYIKGNHAAKKFYADIAAFIRDKGYSVTVTKGEESGHPPGANVWVSHGGLNPPKGTKVLNIPQYPRPFMTKALINALDRVTTK